ncbi:MAG: molybdopterin-dependent oxidoreductase, partial [Candidatus Eremiobacteraeota bacterium]|nr:molybdopterin-dependent oxidoreductase [Candidatus Eremiobacteraeota bacterium]
LAILGANPMLRHPDRALVEAALRAATFVVVTDLFLTETAALADLVLPVCSAFGKSGTTTDLAGHVLPVRGSLNAPNGLPADGDLLVLLAEQLGVALPNVAQLEQRVRDGVRTPPTNFALPPVTPRGPGVDGGVRLIAETTIFTGGGTLAFDRVLTDLRTNQRATLHPATAAHLGIVDGEPLAVTAANGSGLRDVPAVLDPRVPEGAVALIDGIPSAPLNVLGDAVSVRLERAAVAV